MMLFYPMLTSTTVSKNITLAICKTLEKYMLLYRTEDILKLASKNLPKGDRIIKSGRGFSLKESLEEVQEVKLKPDNKKDDDDDEDDKKEKPDKGVKIDLPFKDAFSIEPTYMQVETKTEKQVIGIKVIPYPIKSEGDLAELLLNDRYAPLLVKWLRTFYRAVIRLGWALIRGIRVIPFLSRRPVTGKAVPDIIHAATKHARHIFVLLNQTDIDKSNFLDEPRNVHRLFKQGWTSFVIADDVNQKASFCMQGFIQSGFCTEVNYSYLLSSLGQEKLQIYNDLEDLQKKASPFFRLKKSKKKIFEGRCNKTIEDIVVERKLVLENIEVFSKKAGKIFSSMHQAVKKNDISTVNKLSTTIPKVPISTIEKMAIKTLPNFKDNYSMSQRVLKNSTNLSGDSLKAFSMIISLKSTSKDEVKKNLIKITTAVRNMKNKPEEVIKIIIDPASIKKPVHTIVMLLIMLRVIITIMKNK